MRLYMRLKYNRHNSIEGLATKVVSLFYMNLNYLFIHKGTRTEGLAFTQRTQVYTVPTHARLISLLFFPKCESCLCLSFYFVILLTWKHYRMKSWNPSVKNGWRSKTSLLCGEITEIIWMMIRLGISFDM